MPIKFYARALKGWVTWGLISCSCECPDIFMRILTQLMLTMSLQRHRTPV